MRIAELADAAGVPTTTVRYYERIGLLPAPARTPSGYRDYGGDAATRLVFINRARRMGLTCEQIAELLPVWDGAGCGAAQERVGQLIDEKRAEIAERIAALERFRSQLRDVRATLDAAPAPAACHTDLSCCMPNTPGTGPVDVQIGSAPARNA